VGYGRGIVGCVGSIRLCLVVVSCICCFCGGVVMPEVGCLFFWCGMGRW